MKYDLVIANGHIVDPESGWDGIGHVGVNGDKIAAISKAPLDGKRVIDATGLTVAPGFIDLHAHGQATSAGWMQAFDGVTTALELEAGMLPVAEFYDRTAKEGRPINYGVSSSSAFAREAVISNNTPVPSLLWIFEQMARPEWENNFATDEQLNQIIAMVEQGIKEGGIGIGMPVGYLPGMGYKECYRLAELAKKYNLPVFIHARYESLLEPGSSFEGIEEAIGLAFNPGVHIHICHLNSISLGDVNAIADMIQSAIANGGRITTEAYPYGAGSSPIGSAYYRDPNWKARMGIQACDIEYLGTPLTDTSMAEMQKNHPANIIITQFLHPDTKQKDADILARSVLFPGGAIASDGVPWTMARSDIAGNPPVEEGIWPLPEGAFSHPRSAATFTKFLKDYVRVQQKISLIEAIRKTSLIPAQILEKYTPQMASKGRLKVGADADIVVFDLNKEEYLSTFVQPNQHSLGMEYVIVNGTPLIESGTLNTDARPGKPVRRPVTA